MHSYSKKQRLGQTHEENHEHSHKKHIVKEPVASGCIVVLITAVPLVYMGQQ